MYCDSNLPGTIPGGLVRTEKMGHRSRALASRILILMAAVPQVPEYVEMPMYASMVELMDRFLAEGWPVIEVGILEDGQNSETYETSRYNQSSPISTRFSRNIRRVTRG